MHHAYMPWVRGRGLGGPGSGGSGVYIIKMQGPQGFQHDIGYHHVMTMTMISISRERHGWEVGRLRREVEEEEELLKLLESEVEAGTDEEEGENDTFVSSTSSDDEIANVMQTTSGNPRQD